MSEEKKEYIWFENYTVEMLNGAVIKNTLLETLKISFTEIGKENLVAKMPVSPLTHQPLGVLHGGASVALAESVGSTAANLVLNRNKNYAVGQSINANHLRSKKDGWVYAEAVPVFLGKRSQVWRIDIRDEENELICVTRLTMAVMAYR
jgi:1,4-dihydroxy-2-naphthoyl-CoA hydrolase